MRRDLQVRRRVAAATLVMLAAAGCRDGATEEVDDDDSSTVSEMVVPILVPRELGLAEHWRIAIAEWEADTQSTCQLREYDSEADLDEGAVSAAAGSLVVCPLSLVPRFYDGPKLAAIPDDLTGGWQQVFDGVRMAVGSPGGTPAVLPMSAPPLICCYRADLLEQAGLNPPATWAEYRQLLATVDRWAPGLSVVEPWSDAFRATTFLQRSAGYALHPDNISFTHDVSSGEPLIDQPPFLRALQEIQADFARLDRESLSMSPADCFLRIAEGRAALAIGRLPAGEPFDLDSDNASVRIGMRRLPGASEVYHTQEQTWHDRVADEPNSVTVVGEDAWVVCVIGGAGAGPSRHAWELWNYIDTLERQGGRADAVPRGSRPEDLTERRGVDSGIDEEMQRQFSTATVGSLQISRVVAELPVTGHQRFRELLTIRLTEALLEERAAEDSLGDLAQDWRQLSDELGASTVLNSQRWCLGLSPLADD